MACAFALSTTGGEDFTAATGAMVTLKIEAPAGVDATLLSVQYAAQPIDITPPLQFTVERGLNFLFIMCDASRPGALLQLTEVCSGGGEQVVRVFTFDPFNPGRGFMIRGL